MKVLCVGDQTDVFRTVASVLNERGHETVHEFDLEQAVQALEQTNFDVTAFAHSDPEAMHEAETQIRRKANNYAYSLCINEALQTDKAYLREGYNNGIKPSDLTTHLLTVLDDAELLHSLIAELGDDTEDFPSVGGVIAKSAFNQIFLSGVDRAGRYAEETYVLFIRMNNYQNLYEMGGPYLADVYAASLSKYLVSIRRQSDIIGQISKGGFALLMQRPSYPDEPMEAAKRFKDALLEANHITESSSHAAQISIALVALPSGNLSYSSSLEI